MAIIWITHDLGIVAGLADRVKVMYAGYIVERAEVHEFYANPRHPYTLGLLGSLPRLDAAGARQADAHRGPAARPDRAAAGLPVLCALPLSHRAMPEREPPLARGGARGHEIACWVDVNEEA